MITTETLSTVNNLIKTIPLFGGCSSEKEYEQALELSEYLLDNDPQSPILTMLIAKIEEYEDNLPELAEFNERIAKTPTGVAMLRVLMDQHGLNQSDFENEIGKKSLVSRILNGERSLTIEAIKRLSERFGLPVQLFI